MAEKQEKKEERVVAVRKIKLILKPCTTWLSCCRRSGVTRRRSRGCPRSPRPQVVEELEELEELEENVVVNLVVVGDVR